MDPELTSAVLEEPPGHVFINYFYSLIHSPTQDSTVTLYQSIWHSTSSIRGQDSSITSTRQWLNWTGDWLMDVEGIHSESQLRPPPPADAPAAVRAVLNLERWLQQLKSGFIVVIMAVLTRADGFQGLMGDFVHHNFFEPFLIFRKQSEWYHNIWKYVSKK